ncbi:hypothetical protein D3C71_1473030 [compost metagenome]
MTSAVTCMLSLAICSPMSDWRSPSSACALPSAATSARVRASGPIIAGSRIRYRAWPRRTHRAGWSLPASRRACFRSATEASTKLSSPPISTKACAGCLDRLIWPWVDSDRSLRKGCNGSGARGATGAAGAAGASGAVGASTGRGADCGEGAGCGLGAGAGAGVESGAGGGGLGGAALGAAGGAGGGGATAATRRSGATPTSTNSAVIATAATRGKRRVCCRLNRRRLRLRKLGEALATPTAGRGATPSCTSSRP